MNFRIAALVAAVLSLNAAPNPLHLRNQFADLAAGFDGRVGVCAEGPNGLACLHGDERFSLQSVMKLLVSMAVMDAVDHRGWHLDDPVTIRKQDLSLYVQPIAKLVTPEGYRTTVGDLVRRAIVDSDSAAADILIRKLGSVRSVQDFLDRESITGVRIDRDERHLQTEIVGLVWKPEFVDTAILDAAIARVPKSRRDAAYVAYQKDPRDTATPRGMASLLDKLAGGKLLSAASTAYLLDVMLQTATFPNRLKAGMSSGWKLAHKTGSSGSWNGVAVATNDVGIMMAPDGRKVPIVVFIGDARASSTACADLMRKAAALVVAEYR